MKQDVLKWERMFAKVLKGLKHWGIGKKTRTGLQHDNLVTAGAALEQKVDEVQHTGVGGVPRCAG